jgi:hypothetical protein
MNPKTKNKILKGITTFSIIMLLFGACCLDGEDVVVPVVIMGISLSWLAIFSAANGER